MTRTPTGLGEPQDQGCNCSGMMPVAGLAILYAYESLPLRLATDIIAMCWLVGLHTGGVVPSGRLEANYWAPNKIQ